MVVLGDSYTSGWQGAGTGAHGWPRIVGRERGWHVLNFAVPGTGFLNPGWTRATHPLAGEPDRRSAPGCRRDRGRAQRLPVVTLLDRDGGGSGDRRIHRSLPEAAIVVIGPIWQDGSPPSRCLALRDHLGRTAAAVGAVFVDPIGERWFAGSRHRMIRADGIHPDDAGHRWMAARVLGGPREERDLARSATGRVAAWMTLWIAASRAGARLREYVAVRWPMSRKTIIRSTTTGHGSSTQILAVRSMTAAPLAPAATRSIAPR
jgi:hypothetical protein